MYSTLIHDVDVHFILFELFMHTYRMLYAYLETDSSVEATYLVSGVVVIGDVMVRPRD